MHKLEIYSKVGKAKCRKETDEKEKQRRKRDKVKKICMMGRLWRRHIHNRELVSVSFSPTSCIMLPAACNIASFLCSLCWAECFGIVCRLAQPRLSGWLLQRFMDPWTVSTSWLWCGETMFAVEFRDDQIRQSRRISGEKKLWTAFDPPPRPRFRKLCFWDVCWR